MSEGTTIPGELSAIHARLETGDARMSRIEAGLAENTETTKRSEERIGVVLEVLDAAKGAFKVLQWIGKLARPIGYIVGAVGAVWGAWIAFKNGGVGPGAG